MASARQLQQTAGGDWRNIASAKIWRSLGVAAK
jgi:hypothetical protein